MHDEPDMVQAFERAYRRLMDLSAHDPQIARLIPDDAVTAAIKTPGASLAQIVRATLDGYADREAFGSRAYDIRRDGAGRQVRHHRPSFATITYGALGRQVEAIASAWRHEEELGVKPGDFVAFIGFTGAEYATIDLACAYAQAVIVPLQANIAAADMADILSDTAPRCLVASMDHLELAVDRALGQPTIASLVVIDADMQVDDDRERIDAALARLSGSGVTLVSFAELVARGSRHDWTPLPSAPEGVEALSLIMYTSGSTGTPKGAMIPERIANQYWNGIARMQPIVTLAYAPLNHFMGRNMVASTLAQGGTVHFTLRSDMTSLFEDLRIARPTFLLFIPRVCEMVYQHYQSELQRLIAAGEEPDAADASVRSAMAKNFLGDRLVAGGVGSSPTAPEVRAFIRSCFDIAFVEGYGTTEAGGGITSGNRILRNIIEDYRLLDVPELGYRTTDRPYPRGELLIKSRMAIPGYFKRPAESAAILDADGYQRTGDIVEERGPDHVVWIDRRNNVIKLSQGEYVAIGGLEAAFTSGSALIRQIYVYGSSYRSFLLAVVVPDLDILRDRHGLSPQDSAEVRVVLLAELQATARAAGLKSFEIPRDILVETEAFALENGLLSSVRKPLRPNLYRRYGERLEALYQDMDRQQHAELAMLRREGAALSTVERVAGAFKANLGLASVDPASDQCFADLGGDSLGAVSLAALLEEMFEVAVPVSVILHPAGSAQRLADFVERARAGDGSGPTFASVHGAGATVITASDLTLDRFLDAATFELAEQAAPPADDKRHVLLTGATGFLGRFLCLTWLERLAEKGGRLTCLIRARDADAARERLIEALGGPDPQLAAHFQRLADRHLEVLTGDLSAPRLGLPAETFDRLARSVDHIVHPAALVNHRLSYENLFEPNVVGTAELIRLALTGRKKSFDYTSSTAVPSMHPALREAEDMDVRVGGPACALSDGYAVGYGASKWAGEVLLREAHDHYGLPVNVFRADMILAHRHYAGQINVPDMFTRMLFSVIATGIAPASFYRSAPDGVRAHYDGLPVDFIADVMQQLGTEPMGAFRTYNIVNMHDDGVSLDTIIDWVESAGYPVRRIADYAEWMTEFEDRLRTLPEQQRQLSSIAITSGFAEPGDPTPSHPDSRQFVEAVRRLPAGPQVPHIDEAFIHKYLWDMQSLDLVPAPTALAATEMA
ncbi:carboxylic acid reductase [Sphingobium sp. AN558]|uniref:carboxylic acid reductase n=1 Tax=Sphingobium sp. AN558 TaxID=3133442 RepID=UPI0030C018BA